jgi:hypothetical protein
MNSYELFFLSVRSRAVVRRVFSVLRVLCLTSVLYRSSHR